jgi:UDP-N-acetylmuramoyl-tripeptide--D-alanyl-D-alanine ligase
MKSAIDTVGRMEAGSRILVLGDILELGSYSGELHRSVAQHINESPYTFDHLFTFGESSKAIHENAEVEAKHHYSDIGELAGHLAQVMRGDSVILLKGSRGMALERVNDYI